MNAFVSDIIHAIDLIVLAGSNPRLLPPTRHASTVRSTRLSIVIRFQNGVTGTMKSITTAGRVILEIQAPRPARSSTSLREAACDATILHAAASISIRCIPALQPNSERSTAWPSQQ
jgi:hypothetical protein